MVPYVNLVPRSGVDIYGHIRSAASVKARPYNCDVWHTSELWLGNGKTIQADQPLLSIRIWTAVVGGILLAR